jgi:hypothetical protein
MINKFELKFVLLMKSERQTSPMEAILWESNRNVLTQDTTRALADISTLYIGIHVYRFTSVRIYIQYRNTCMLMSCVSIS